MDIKEVIKKAEVYVRSVREAFISITGRPIDEKHADGRYSGYIQEYVDALEFASENADLLKDKLKVTHSIFEKKES